MMRLALRSLTYTTLGPCINIYRAARGPELSPCIECNNDSIASIVSSEKPIKGMLLALGHQARVGKDAFADYVARKYGCVKVSFAEDVYAIAGACQGRLGLTVEKDPGLLQTIGMGLRTHYGDDIWVKGTMSRIRLILEKDPNANIIVCDMRFPNEMKALKEAGFVTVKLTRDGRPIDRDPNHISERALEGAIFDVELQNNGSLEAYYMAIDQLLRRYCVC